MLGAYSLKAFKGILSKRGGVVCKGSLKYWLVQVIGFIVAEKKPRGICMYRQSPLKSFLICDISSNGTEAQD